MPCNANDPETFMVTYLNRKNSDFFFKLLFSQTQLHGHRCGLGRTLDLTKVVILLRECSKVRLEEGMESKFKKNDVNNWSFLAYLGGFYLMCGWLSSKNWISVGRKETKGICGNWRKDFEQWLLYDAETLPKNQALEEEIWVSLMLC